LCRQQRPKMNEGGPLQVERVALYRQSYHSRQHAQMRQGCDDVSGGLQSRLYIRVGGRDHTKTPLWQPSFYNPSPHVWSRSWTQGYSGPRCRRSVRRLVARDWQCPSGLGLTMTHLETRSSLPAGQDKRKADAVTMRSAARFPMLGPARRTRPSDSRRLCPTWRQAMSQ
jgi:hypothetical protein